MKKVILISIILFWGMHCLLAQTYQVSGKVIDSDGASLLGANITVKGSYIGTVSNIEGFFEIDVPDTSTTLVVAFIGMETREINVQGKTFVDVSMSMATHNLDDVVVTALGISREKKSLGYSVQEVQGDDLNEARESNFVNSLAGRIAGVKISSSPAVGSSSRITIRGENSFNFHGNQPLYVIDGVPVGNSGTSNSTSADYGNSSAEINPSDIASVNVLKGAAASALYGSRAINGVVVIETKSGKGSKGVSVSLESGLTFEEVLRLPKFQNEFGQGKNGEYSGSNFGASTSIYPDGIYDGYDESWGPRLNAGTLEAQFDSPTLGGMRGADVANPNRGEVIPTPWVSQNDNIKDFFEIGRTMYNNIALTGGNEKGSFRLSYTNLDQKGNIPNNDLQRNTVAFKVGYQLSKRLKTEASINYINTQGTNRPETGYGRHSLMYFMVWTPRNININSLKDYWQEGFEGSKQFQYNYGENHNNPYFYLYENTKGQDKHRVYGQLKLSYDFTEKLNLNIRAGQDVFHDHHPMQWAVSTVNVENGRYRDENYFEREENYEFLLNYRDNLGNFNFSASAGGNYMRWNRRVNMTEAPQLLVPGIYSLSNSATELVATSWTGEKVIQSLYAFAQLDYKKTVFMELTGRNDWSSTLPLDNNSYFYPSASLSVLANEMIRLPNWLTMAKLRVGVAGVGGDTAPYSLTTPLNFGLPWDNNYALSINSTLGNNTLEPEKKFSYEIGTDIRFFNNRLKFDFAYYDTRTKNQIMSIELPTSTSYTGKIINAGEIQNRGIELMVHARPVETAGGFSWDIYFNYAKNISKVLELDGESDILVQTAPGEDASIQARKGERMGAIYGPGYQRVESGPMKGEIIIFDNGRPKPTSDDIHLGNINPDWTGSISNSFRYKRFDLNTLVDIQWGGDFISRFYNKGMGAGQLEESAKGRSARLVGNEYDDNYYMEGAAELEDGTYTPNNLSTDGTYSEGVYGVDGRGFHKYFLDHISEGQVFDATYIKLREIRFGYVLPDKIFGDRISHMKVSVVGRNLLLWTPDSNQHFDPEVSVATAGSGLVPGFENMSFPSVKSYGFNISVKF